MRDGPGKEHAVVATLARGQTASEVGREGDWIQIRLDAADAPTGWVHRSLLSPPTDAAAGQAPASAGPGPIKALELAVDQLNAFPRNQGYAYFASVADLGGGGAAIVATEEWMALPEGFRASNFAALESIWRGAAGALGPAWLRILGPDGATVMETGSQVAGAATEPEPETEPTSDADAESVE
jgi:hypothetical protein